MREEQQEARGRQNFEPLVLVPRKLACIASLTEEFAA
jgi:hypothetical protein